MDINYQILKPLLIVAFKKNKDEAFKYKKGDIITEKDGDKYEIIDLLFCEEIKIGRQCQVFLIEKDNQTEITKDEQLFGEDAIIIPVSEGMTEMYKKEGLI